jgi:hypothetical protein
MDELKLRRVGRLVTLVIPVNRVTQLLDKRLVEVFSFERLCSLCSCFFRFSQFGSIKEVGAM